MEMSDLNPEQLAAVTHGTGPMLVVAGAGTGKTAVITRRIEWLIKNGYCRAEEILALTFTDKAAGEMLDRLDGLLGWDAYRVNVMTFHAFGGTLLRRFGHHLGWPTSTELISDVGKLTLLKQHLSEVKLSYYGAQNDLVDFLDGCLNYIKNLQNADISLEQFKDYVDAMGPEHHIMDVAETKDRLAIYGLYEKLKRQRGVIDYDDQIKLPLQLLIERPNLAQRLREQYKFVLVDEYQDTNSAQDALLRSFVPADGNITAVGDDDQAIYGFRGAKLSNILNFADHFKVSKPVVLIENYRSGQEILDAAYRLIKHNDPDRLEAKLGLDKRLHGQVQGEQPRFQGYNSPREEAEAVAAGIEERLAAGVPPIEMAVLATAHASLKQVAKVLRERGLPYQLSSNVNIFEQPEILQLWYLLRWIGLEAGDEAIAQLLMGPFVNWSSDQVRQLVEISNRDLISLEATFEKIAASKREAERLREKLETWREWAKQMPVSQLAYQLVFESGVSDDWVKRAQSSSRMVKVFEDLQLWLKHMQQFEGFALDPTLTGYISSFPKPPEIESEEVSGNENGVALLTIHASKGLEFKTVFLINSTEDAWSDKSGGRGVELPTGLVKQELELPPEHERRRMMYVAITRAKAELLLSAPVFTTSGRMRRITQYLNEMFGEAGFKTSAPIPTNKMDSLLQKLQRYAPKTMSWTEDRLPFETADGWLELSTTDLEKYDRCPYEFYLEKVLKIRTPVGPQINFGSLLHELFREYYQSRQLNEALSLKQLQERLLERWSDRGYRSQDEVESGKQVAIKTLESFYAREETTDRKLRLSEESFNLVLGEYKLRVRGRIDASFVTDKGIEVRDFKTGRQRDPEKLSRDAKQNLQLRTYALAVEDMVGKPPARVVLDYVVTGVEGVAELTPLILRNHRAKLGQIAESIRAHQFEPNSDTFHTCVAYRYWGNGEEDEGLIAEAASAR